MEHEPININGKFPKFSDHWAPKVIATMNDYHFKLIKIEGEFVWHKHEDTDEVFIIIEGEASILFRDGKVDLKAGELIVVPKGVEHKPVAREECKMMVIEPAGTVNTGDAGGRMTAENDVWV